ncbi:helix-turn-helix domain-containing protein [Geomicrobium sp. JSM 1781026]|uniref:helix-turn-helix domain-containing protein n=1 Tax=Geomicrobium sp. JSM 1781026 TaxID=3344580 RepID=UPI0035C0E6E8
MSWIDDRIHEARKDPEFEREWQALKTQKRIANNLSRLRSEQDLSVQSLAARLNVPPYLLSKIESRDIDVSEDLLQKLAEHFNVTADELKSDPT